ESSFWRADGEGSNTDEEVVAAAAPSLMTAPGGGYLVLSSSVYRKRGLMYERFKQLHGRDDAEDLVWVAPSLQMNASLPGAEIEKAISDDPEKNRAEFLAIWRDDLADFIPADVIEHATDRGVIERPRVTGQRYCGFIDAAGGTGQDSMAMGIAHAQRDG